MAKSTLVIAPATVSISDVASFCARVVLVESVFLLGRRYVNEISFWASLPFGFLISCLGVRLPVGKTFS